MLFQSTLWDEVLRAKALDPTAIEISLTGFGGDMDAEKKLRTVQVGTLQGNLVLSWIGGERPPQLRILNASAGVHPAHRHEGQHSENHDPIHVVLLFCNWNEPGQCGPSLLSVWHCASIIRGASVSQRPWLV